MIPSPIGSHVNYISSLSISTYGKDVDQLLEASSTDQYIASLSILVPISSRQSIYTTVLLPQHLVCTD